MTLLNRIRKVLGLRLRHYKVVLNRGEQLLSAIGPTRVRYYPNQWARPLLGNGPLCVFETRRRAIKFITTMRLSYWSRTLEVWICEIHPTEHILVWCQCRSVKHFQRLTNLPAGTKLACRVKLLRKTFSWTFPAYDNARIPEAPQSWLRLKLLQLAKKP